MPWALRKAINAWETAESGYLATKAWAEINRQLNVAIAAAVAEERSRWLAWAMDLGYDEQELPMLK